MEATEFEIDVQDEGMGKVRDGAGIEVWLCSRCFPVGRFGTTVLAEGDAAEDVLRDDVSDLVSAEGVVHYEIRCEACDVVLAEAE